jgi:hypothetical protein
MKSKYLKITLLLAVFCFTKALTSQNLVSSWYTFTTSTSTYSAIASGSVLGTNTNDNNFFNAVPIGFAFNFLGANYTNVSVNSNGYLKFGSPQIYVSTTLPIDNGLGIDSLISALGSDLESISSGTATGVLSYTTLGISPNKTFVVQWANYTSFGNADILNFQIRLYETTNKIDVIYGNMSLSSYIQAQVGLRGNGLLDFNNRSIISGTNSWTTSVVGSANSDYCELDPGPPVFGPTSGRKFTWNPPPPCTGTPLAGTLNATSGTIACIGQNLNLNITGAISNFFGLTYQWQSSANGSTWTSVPSATNSAYTPTYNLPIFYRRVIACGVNTAASSTINFSTIANVTYTSIPFLENFNSTWQNRCDLKNVPQTACWSSNPATGNSSWRRQDDGVSANWTNTFTAVVPLQGSGAADFNSDNATGGVSGALDLYVNMGTTQNYDVSFYYYNDNGDDSLEVFLSNNGGSSFVKQAVFQSATYAPFLSGWNKKIVSLLSVNSPSCVVRFQGTSTNFSFFGDHIGIDSLKIAVQPTCTGTPSPATISSPLGSTICIGQTITFSVTGGTSGFSGLTYQWQSSTNGSTWAAIPSATTPVYSLTYSTPLFYRRVISCGINSAATNTLNFATTSAITYTSVPFLENFNSTWQNRCDLRNVPISTCWSSNPTTGNNSWRRQDDGVSANWTNTNNLSTPLQGLGCAQYNHSGNPLIPGALDLYINMGTTQNYDVSFYYDNDFGDDSLEILLSTNGGGFFVKQAAFKSGDYAPFLTGWNKKVVSLLSVNSTSCVLRFQARSDVFLNSLAMDSLKIVVQPTCTGTPSAATISSPLGSTICLGQTLTFSVTGGTTGFSGLTYQWQSSTNGTTWAAIPSATTPAYSLTYSTPLFYRRIIACGVNSATTNILSFTTTIPISYATVPFLENFDGTWQDRCDTRNVPTTSFWSSNPTSSNNSWRRQDDGISANWTNASFAVSPLTGAGCANFHSTDATTLVAGVLDLNVNMGTIQNYEVSFYHINDFGTDSLEVFLSTNAGGTFTRRAVFFSGDVNTIESSWNRKTINLIAVNSASCVLRFKATSDLTPSDIGLDSLKIKLLPCVTPTLVLSASSTSICSGTASSLTVNGAASYTWNTSATTSVIVVNPTATIIYTVAGSNGLGCNSTRTISVIVNVTPTVTTTSNASIICVGSTATLTANGATTYSWSSGGITPNIAVSPSITTTYSVIGNFGLPCPSSTVITQLVDPCLGVNTLSSTSDAVAVYPNPFKEELTISTTEDVNVKFFNVIGQVVMEKSVNKTDVINTQGFAKGVYNVVVTGASSIRTFKVIKD